MSKTIKLKKLKSVSEKRDQRVQLEDVSLDSELFKAAEALVDASFLTSGTEEKQMQEQRKHLIAQVLKDPLATPMLFGINL